MCIYFFLNAPYPQCLTQNMHSVHFFGSITGALNPSWLMALAGQCLMSGQRWSWGQLAAMTVIIFIASYFYSYLSQISYQLRSIPKKNGAHAELFCWLKILIIIIDKYYFLRLQFCLLRDKPVKSNIGLA
jgi:hypothetical protein